MAHRRSVLAVALVVLVACGTSPSQPPSSGASTAGTIPPTTISPSTNSPSTGVTAGPTPSTTATSTTAVPPTSTEASTPSIPVDPSAPLLLLADEAGVRRSDGTVFVDGESVALAVPDLMGGVVYQAPQNEIADLGLDEELGRNVYLWSGDGPEPIWHVANPGAPPSVLVEHPDADIRLIDVVEVDGRPQVLYRMAVGGPGREPAAWLQVLEWLHLLDLTTGETRVLGLVGSWDSSDNRIRIGAELVAVARDEFGAESGTAVGMVELARLSAPVSQRWLPELVLDDLVFGPRHACGEGEECWRRWAVATAAHDGSRLAWLEGVWDDGDSSLVVRTAASADAKEETLADLGRVAIYRWRDISLDDDGTWVVFGGGGLPTVTLVGTSGTLEIEQAVSSVRLWRETIETTAHLPAQDLGVELGDDGIGPVAFGTSREETLLILEEALGPHSRSWDGFFHYYGWDWLGLTLAFRLESGDGVDRAEQLVAWVQAHGVGPSLRTTGGVGLGDTYADLISAYGSEVSEPRVPEECVPEWFVWLGDPATTGFMVVFDTEPGPAARITYMRAGLSEGC